MYSYPSASPFLFAFVFMQTSQDPGSWVHETVLRWSVMRAGMWVQSCVMASSKHTDPVLGEGTTRLLLRNTMSSSGACLLHNLPVPLLLWCPAWSAGQVAAVSENSVVPGWNSLSPGAPRQWSRRWNWKIWGTEELAMLTEQSRVSSPGPNVQTSLI